MARIFWASVFILFALGCGGSSYHTTANDDPPEDYNNYSGDTYCAEVDYYNPNTGTNSSYTLTVEVESNEVTQINWPNGGWLDEDHFSGAEIDESGHTSFTSDEGNEYEIQIVGESYNCFESVPKAVRCRGITKRGNRCRNMTDNPDGVCWQHQSQIYDDNLKNRLEDNSNYDDQEEEDN